MITSQIRRNLSKRKIARNMLNFKMKISRKANNLRIVKILRTRSSMKVKKS